MVIELPHHIIELRREEQLVITHFEDGTEAHACPHNTPEYHQHAIEKSTGDILTYCWMHDLVHCLLAEVHLHAPSPTLWALAHDQPTDTREIAAEEVRVAEFQRAFMMRPSDTTAPATVIFGTCPVCKFQLQLGSDGALDVHQAMIGRPICKGSGKKGESPFSAAKRFT